MNTFGPVYDEAIDGARLATQMDRIRDYMLKADRFLTLDEVSAALDYPPASVSAQLRHLRKRRFGAYHVEKRRRGGARSGLWEYLVWPPRADATSLQHGQAPYTKMATRQQLRDLLHRWGPQKILRMMAVEIDVQIADTDDGEDPDSEWQTAAEVLAHVVAGMPWDGVAERAAT